MHKDDGMGGEVGVLSISRLKVSKAQTLVGGCDVQKSHHEQAAEEPV